MIYASCAHAADLQLGEDEHCDSQSGPGAQCTCQHRTSRYGTAFRPQADDTPAEAIQP